MTALKAIIEDVEPSPAASANPRTAETDGLIEEPIDRALRLGSMALGCPLVFTDAGSQSDAAGGASALLPAVAFSCAAPVVGDDGEALGTVRALDLTARPDFTAQDRRALSDVASLIGDGIAARLRVGRINSVSGRPARSAFEADFPQGAGARGRSVVLVTLAEARHYNELLRALGHDCAESFVRNGADILSDCIGEERRIYHVSVLSFAFITNGPHEDPETIARGVVAAFTNPIQCDGLPIATRIGIGMTRLNLQDVGPAEALRAALAAAQDSRGKAEGFAFYDRRSDEAHLRAFNLLTDLVTALDSEEQLALAFQPRIDLATGKIVCAEALIRWTHPILGSISPAEFIPLAETTALMDRLTDWVLDRACRQSAALTAAGRSMKLSINISPNSLHDSGFLGRVERALSARCVLPSSLEFEFTEGILTSAEAGVRSRIDALRTLGIAVAIDDFGTGYSNLDYLTRIPADVLKIDRCFVQPLDHEPRHRMLVRSMIDMSHDLGFRVVAEGVETATAYEMLGDWGCEEGQGFYMSRPLPAIAFHALATAG